MSVVDREALKEAIEMLADGSAAVTIEDIKAIRVAIRASIAVLEGEATDWCEKHNEHRQYGKPWCWEWEVLGGSGEPCSMVRVVVVPIEED